MTKLEEDAAMQWIKEAAQKFNTSVEQVIAILGSQHSTEKDDLAVALDI